MLILSTPEMLADVATALKGVILGPPAATLHLFQNNIVPSANSVATDFTEATFDGYASQTFAVLFGPTRETDGSFVVDAFMRFHMTGSVTPNTIYGAYVLKSTGEFLIATRFPAPVAMVDAFSDLECHFSIGVALGGLAGDMAVAG